MLDQAEHLRAMVKSMQKSMRDQLLEQKPRRCRVIAVTSGKGGVGKTNISVNLAVTLARARYRVVLMDGDMGLANVDVLLGAYSRYDLSHVVRGEMTLEEIVIEGPEGLKIIPGGSGVEEMANITPSALMRLLDEVAHLDRQADYLFIDTGAGISAQVMLPLLAAEEVLLVTTPEPTSLTDAYGLIKVFHKQQGRGRIKVIVNMARNEQEGRAAGERLQKAVRTFLGRDLENLGYVTMDKAVRNAVSRHQPYVTAYPNSQAALNTVRIASELGGVPCHTAQGARSFFNSLISILNRKS